MKLFIPLADGFEDIEAISVIDILRRAGIAIDSIGIPGSVIISRSGIRYNVDKKFIDLRVDEYDGIILPGGGKSVETLSRTSAIIEAVKKLNERGKLVAAICAAPAILAKSGILDSKRATIYPGLEKELPKPRGDKVVVDGNIITSQGPGTTIEFALKIVEIVKGRGKSEQIREEIVA